MLPRAAKTAFGSSPGTLTVHPEAQLVWTPSGLLFVPVPGSSQPQIAVPGFTVSKFATGLRAAALLSVETVSLKPNSAANGELVAGIGLLLEICTFQIQLPAGSNPPFVTETVGAAKTGEATTHNKLAVTKYFQDISVSP